MIRAVFKGLLASLVWMSVAAAAAPADIDELLETSGLNAQLDALPGVIAHSIEQGIAQSGQRVPAHHVTALAAQARADYDPTSLRATVRAALAALSPADVERNLRWLNSDAGRRVTAAEIAAGTTEGVAAMKRFLLTVASDATGADRRARVVALDRALHATERMVSLQRNAALSMLVAANAMAPTEMQRSYQELEGIVDQLMARGGIEQMSGYTQLAMVHTYRNIPDSALDAYLAHLDTAAGQAFAKAVFDGMEQGIFNASARYGRSLIGVLAELASETSS